MILVQFADAAISSLSHWHRLCNVRGRRFLRLIVLRSWDLDASFLFATFSTTPSARTLSVSLSTYLAELTYLNEFNSFGEPRGQKNTTLVPGQMISLSILRPYNWLRRMKKQELCYDDASKVGLNRYIAVKSQRKTYNFAPRRRT